MPRFRTAQSLILAVAVLAALLLPAGRAAAGTVPAGFEESVAFSGLSEPTSIAFSPDGRVFVAQKSGVIKVFDNLSDPTPDTFANLSAQVYNFWDRGLLGMALDPEFPAKPYVYVLYTLDAMPGEAGPKWGGKAASDPCPTPPGATKDGCVATGRLSRLTASGNAMSEEKPLITDWCQQFPSHSVGDLAFGPEGALFVSGGEGASFTAADWGQYGNPVNPCGDPPGGVGALLAPPGAEGGSLRSQDVRTLADPTGLDGSLLRIDPETGEGLPANPFAASSDPNARRILAYGFRNPFRLAIRPGTDEIWAGDVGQGTWEEIDRVDPAAATSRNYGWPCYEGGKSTSSRLGSWDAANLDLCESLYAQGSGGVAAPHFGYRHNNPVVAGEGCGTSGGSISGLAFYEAGPFPNAYNGALFFADYTRNCIWAMLPGADGLPDPTQIEPFDVGAAAPVNLKVGPDGALYFADLSKGRIWRIGHGEGNQPPSAQASANPGDGAAPLQVQLSAAGSSDPNPGDELSYAWDLDGDGEFDDAAEVAPSYLYEQPGIHTAVVRVSDPDGASDTDSVEIQVDNMPPLAAIDSPAAGSTWAVGDEIAFAASATDAQEELPDSAFAWTVAMHHCDADAPGHRHQHTIESLGGRAGSIVAPDHEYPSWLELRLQVTDAEGLTDTESRRLDPRTVELTLNSLPTGRELSIGSVSGPAPLTATVIAGSNNSVSAAVLDDGSPPLAFGGWSDGGAASHNVLADADTTLTAVYGPPAAPAILATTPSSSPTTPAHTTQPLVHGSVGADFPVAVQVYANAGCTGVPAATGTPAQFASGLAVSVAADATTMLTASATNAAGRSACSPALAYVEDSTPPAAPALSRTVPDSPANENVPRLLGSGEPGATVHLFASPDCSSPEVAAGDAVALAAGIPVLVGDDSTTAFSARAESGGMTSPCSNPLAYVEDSTAPAAPAPAPPAPAARANDNAPRIGGRASEGVVRLYAGGNCTGAALASVGAAALPAGVPVAVADDSLSAFSLDATDLAGNRSACSSAVEYREDSTAPQTRIARVAMQGVAGRRTGKGHGHRRGGRHRAQAGAPARVAVAIESDDSGARYECRLDDGAFSACAAPVLRLRLAPGAHRVFVRAVDAVGNADQTPATRRLLVPGAAARH